MIYFIRHGQTPYNKVGKLQGILDIPLSAIGRKQAKVSAEKLKEYKIDIIYSSPLKRALKTAQTINKYHNVPIKTTDALIEFDVGKKLEKKYLKDLPEDFFEKVYDNANNYGQEDVKSFRKRLKDFLLSLDQDKNILLVSHGGVYTQIEYFISGKIMKAEIENCTPVKINIEGINNDR